MRDDIHKRAPGPPHWRRVVRALQREADWAETGARAAAQALVAELAAAEGPAFFAALDREVSSPQLALVPDLGPSVDAAAGGRLLSNLQKYAVGHLLQLAPERPNAMDLVVSAVTAGLNTVLNAYKRELDVVLACEFKRDRAEVIRRITAVFDSLPLVSWAREVVAGRLPQLPGAPTLDIDAVLA